MSVTNSLLHLQSSLYRSALRLLMADPMHQGRQRAHVPPELGPFLQLSYRAQLDALHAMDPEQRMRLAPRLPNYTLARLLAALGPELRTDIERQLPAEKRRGLAAVLASPQGRERNGPAM
jgi:hypothetical protein